MRKHGHIWISGQKRHGQAYFNKWPKVDNICNNACEVFNGKIAQFIGKPILTLAEEVKRYIIKTMIANKLKLLNYPGNLA